MDKVKYRIRGWVEQSNDHWIKYMFQVNIIEPVMDEACFTFSFYATAQERAEDRSKLARKVRSMHKALWERAHARLDCYEEWRKGRIMGKATKYKYDSNVGPIGDFTIRRPGRFAGG